MVYTPQKPPTPIVKRQPATNTFLGSPYANYLAQQNQTMNPTQWAGQVLSDLGINAQKDPNAVQDILSWMKNEEPANQWWGGFGPANAPTRLNPLNTGGGAGYTGDPVTGNVTSGGLGTYGSLDQAAQAVATTLRDPANSQYGYAPIIQALMQGDNPQQFGQAVSASDWAGSHYAGRGWAPGQEAGGPAVKGGNYIGPGQQALNAFGQDTTSLAGASGNLQNTETAGQAGIAGANQQLSLQQLQQQYQNLLANLGIEQTGLGQQQQYQSGQYGLQQALLNLQRQYAKQQYGFQQQGDILSQQGIQEAMKNLQQQFGFSTQNIESGTAASGVYNTGTRKQEETQNYQQFLNNMFQQQQAMKQLGLTEQEQKAGLTQQLGQYGIQGQQEALTNTYQQQQLQNALQRLGLERTYAGQEYSTGQQGLYNDYLSNLYSIMQGQGQIYGGQVGQIAQMMQNFTQAAPPTGG